MGELYEYDKIVGGNDKMKSGLLNELNKRILFCDGGMGSLLQEKGLKAGELPETWNITHKEILVGIHKSYLEAGADIITTNTFGANRLKYNEKKDYTVEQVVTAALDNAKQAVNEAEGLTGKKGYIALDLGPTGKLLEPLGDLPFEEAYELFRETVVCGAKEGADLVLIETMSDGYEAKAAVLAAKENCDLPVFVSMVFDGNGKLLTGGDVAATVALLEGLGVDALGINCGLGPVQMKGILVDILEVASIPVIVNPNAGLPRSVNGKTVYDIDADQFAKVMKEIAAMGARVIGGCCGTTPEHIQKTVELCKDLPMAPVTDKKRTVISSYSHAVVIDNKPVIIGERINPTGKSKFKQALRDHDLEYILDEGVAQEERGAHVLDVNVGLPEIDEPSMMEEVIVELQSIIKLPLQIDTSNMEAMERAMRIYNGKPMINSVNGKLESMEAVFPLVQKYGGVVVALTLDEDGIPETAKGRVRIAKKIYKKAAEYGISEKDILIDALCLTVSSDSKGALTTLETLRRVKEELGGKTILGVSNISFGLPQREIINASFFTMALHSGLNAAIINPNSEAMMRSYYSYRVLADLDPHCGDYIEVYGGQASGNGMASGSGTASGNGQAAGNGQASGNGQAAGNGQASGNGMAAGCGTASGNKQAAGNGMASGNSQAAEKKHAAGSVQTAGKNHAAGSVQTAGNGSSTENARNNDPKYRKSASVSDLGSSIIKGLKNQASDAVKELLKTRDSLEIINEEMIPALNVVGNGFEKGTMFLPQLLMSAEAAKAAFEVIKEQMAVSGRTQEKKGRVILATVKGDIHDIGKNIVKVLLENYSYDVIDLGKDVPPETVVEKAVELNVPLVGLSALMTTTVPSMEETIKQLRKSAPWVKIMVGGAVMTEEYSQTIGADRYCKDAMASVNYAEDVIVEPFR
ncbi:homocysteine S-methyltransferase family protein [Clostridium sp. MCC353]|uniref:homocysteine S-methyltransferase family protein n=1 Tax=Clostridium sp. MCC353 TaxID=2592646 RepID=UPI00207A7243|nr:homocysteine S-methyltransferase family protein [Clostridium sp. MCC353]